MDEQRSILRMGAGIVALAVFLQLLSSGTLEPLTRLPTGGWPLTAMVFLQTGRLVRLPEQGDPEPTEPMTQPVTQPATQPTTQPVTQPNPQTYPPSPEVPSLSVTKEDLAYVSVSYGCDYRPDLAALLTKPLFWDLRSSEPTVLILHTHATECYTPAAGEEIALSGDYRTLDREQNMVFIGEQVASILRGGGIGVIHDTTLHDSPSYEAAYSSARETIQKYLTQYPSIRLVLDLHRDASGGGGAQLVTTGTVGGQRSAQLMLVVGTDAGGSSHDNWQENLALALKLQTVLEWENPGLCRDLNFRAQRFNQDLTLGSLIVEVGAAGNTRAEAALAAQALAQGILALANGVNTS